MSIFKKKEKTENTKPVVRKKFKARYVVIPVVVLLVGGIVVSNIYTASMPMVVETEEVSTNDILKTIETSGTISSDETKVYFAGADGEIEAVNVEVGDSVAAGDILYTYNQDSLKLSLDTAQTKLAASEYNYQNTMAKHDEASAEYARTEGNVANLKAKINQMNKDGASLEEIQDAQEALAENKSQNSVAKAGVMTELEIKALQANRKLESLSDNSIIDSIKSVQDGVSADFNGIVTDVKTVNGAPVLKGSEIMTIANSDAVHVNIRLTKSDLAYVTEGQDAEITFNKKVYSGKVSKISKVAGKNESGSTVVEAQIEILDADDALVLGTDAKVKIFVGEAKNVVAITNLSILYGADGPFVYVVEDGILAIRNITLGINDEFVTEVKSGLEAGEQIVSSDTEYLMEGMAVSTSNASAE